jgi:hypothetical protein
VKWDGKQFVIDKKLLNVAEELSGNKDYAQPTS